MIPMKSGLFSDTGYRFRQNYFNRYDDWYPLGSYNSTIFYDLHFYNSDTVTVGDDYTKIAEMFYRLEVDEI